MTDHNGWPIEAPTLLAEIAADNTLEFWRANRERHEELVLAPMRELAVALAVDFGQLRVLRPQVNRRFRPEVPPFRTDTGGVATTGGGSLLGVVLSATALSASGGIWGFDRAQLQRFRAAVDGPPGADLEAVLTATPGFEVHRGRALASAPRGWSSGHPRIALLRHRGLQLTRSWELGPWLESGEPLRRVRAAWHALAPLLGWLDEHVGAADPVAARPRPAPAAEVQPAASAESTSDTSRSA
ncbi:DUF2461 family protein [Pseudonocardia sp. GCM10023141]|uniref:DUF2461 family protein n=1 Tax=Pseudonocardia sp. GCM10023141 TaxID=3252653 RepID=UPI00360CD79A